MAQASKKNGEAALTATKKADRPKSVTPDVLMPEEPAAETVKKPGKRTAGKAARGAGAARAVSSRGRKTGSGGRSNLGALAAEDRDELDSREDDSDELDMDILQPEDDSDELDMDILQPEDASELEGDLEGDLDDLEREELDLESESEEDGEDDGVKYLGERPKSGSDLPVPADSRLPQVRDNLQLYVREVCRFPLLKPDEEHDLAVRFRDTQDKDAAFKLVSSHLRLVVKIAMDFQRRWMQNVLDLVQEGNVGLLHALYKFDPDKGIKFSYYSSFWIKAYILKFIMDNFRMVKIGTTQVQRKLFFNLNRERQKLIAQGFNPDAEMLSKHLGVSTHDIREMEQRLSSADVSLNVPVGDESDSASRIDFLPALDPGVEESIANSEISEMLHEKLKTLLPRLSDKELYILENRLFTDSPETLREIGERYNITRERVRQLEIRLLEKIKQHLSADIKDFSDVWLRP